MVAAPSFIKLSKELSSFSDVLGGILSHVFVCLRYSPFMKERGVSLQYQTSICANLYVGILFGLVLDKG